MAEPMSIFVEVWPFAADDLGIWLVSGDDAWRPTLPVMADTEPHNDVEFELSDHGALDKVALLHSTSWRADGPHVILTYVAILNVTGSDVLADWPQARPVSPLLPSAVGHPPTHAAVEPPAPRYIDVMLHGIRHLSFLQHSDTTARSAMPNPWPQHLQGLEPALAGMYSDQHQS
jgi:hypothetical protein